MTALMPDQLLFGKRPSDGFAHCASAHRRNQRMTLLRFITIVLLATLTSCTAVQLFQSSSDVGADNLHNTVLTLAPTSSQVTLDRVTLVGWEEMSTVGAGAKVTLRVPASVSIRVGDSRGGALQPLPQGDSSIEITRSGDTLSAVLKVGTGTNLSVKTRGEFEELGSMKAWIEDYGVDTSDPAKKRVRIWVHYYGIETAFTLVDG